MVESVHAFGLVFGLVGLLFAAIGIAGIAGIGYRLTRRRRLLTKGLTAEARCLEVYLTHDRDSEGATRTTRHAILGFHTEDGRDIRIDATTGFTGIVGDFTTVRYHPEHPDQAIAVGTNPGAGCVVAFAVATTLFLTVFTCVGLLFAAVGFGIVNFDPTVQPTAPTHPWAP